MKRALLLPCFTLVLLSLSAQTPKAYYQFDATDPGNDTTANNNVLTGFSLTGNAGAIQSAGGVVGDYLLMDSVFAQIETQDSLNPVATITPADSMYISIEFLIKLNDTFAKAQPITWDERFAMRLTDHYWWAEFTMAGNPKPRNAVFDLDGANQKDFSYYQDGEWHHIAITFDSKSGDIKLYIDGVSPAGFTKEMKTAGPLALGSLLQFRLGDTTWHHRGCIDEIAIYNSLLVPKMVYRHYLDAIVNNSHYQFLNPTDPAVDTLQIPEFVTVLENDFNPLDYAEGYPNVTLTPPNLLKSYPGARFLPNHGLPKIYPFFGDWYNIQGSTDYHDGKLMQREMVKHYNYMLSLGDEGAYRASNFYSDTLSMGYQFSQLALESDFNGEPHFLRTDWEHNKTYGIDCNGNTITFGDKPGSIYLYRQDLDDCDTTADYYITTDLPGYPKMTKRDYLGPLTPLDPLKLDGAVVRSAVVNLYDYLGDANLNGVTSTKAYVNAISENGEAPTIKWSPQLIYDSKIVNDKLVNYPTIGWDKYEAMKKRKMSNAYSDVFTNYIDSNNVNSSVFQTHFLNDKVELQWYKVAGLKPQIAEYDSFKTVQKTNSSYRRTSQYVTPQQPKWWRAGLGWVNGTHRHSQARSVEITKGDKLARAFVNPGYYINKTYANYSNTDVIRPGQWLSLLKHVGCLGSDTYTNFMYYAEDDDSLTDEWEGNWRTWEIVLPSYSQAITSRADDFLYNGDLKAGSGPGFPTGPTKFAFQTTGSYLDYVTVRQSATNSDKYLIVGSRQKLNNGASHGIGKKITGIKLDGDSLKFEIRTQGSVYTYNKSNATFIQLDGWHENKEPSRWCKDYEIEAELANVFSPTTYIDIETEKPSGAATGDFSEFTTFTSLNQLNAQVAPYYMEYSVLIRDEEQDTLWPWFLARHEGLKSTNDTVGLTLGSTTSTGMDWPPDTLFEVIQSLSWTWYRLIDANGNKISLDDLPVGGEFTFRLYSLNHFAEMDKILLVRSNDSIIGDPLIASFSASDTTVCPSDTITFTNTSSTWGSCYSLEWDLGNGLRSFDEQVDHYWDAPGSYQVILTVTDSCGERSAQDTLMITVDGPYVDAGEAQFICPDTTTQLDGTVDGTSFHWLSDPLLISTNVLDPLTDTISQSATFYLVADSNSCNDTDSVKITIVEPDVNDTTMWVCNPKDTVHVVLDGAFYFDFWTLDNPQKLDTNHGSPFPYFVADSAGKYSFRVKATDVCRCRTDTVLVTIIAGREVILTNDTLACPGPDVEIQLEAEVDTLNPFKPFVWAPGTGLNSINIWNPKSAARDSQTYFLFFTDAIDSVCYDSVTIDRHKPPQILPGKFNTVCHGDVIELTVQSGYDSLLWTPSFYVSDSTNDTTLFGPIWNDTDVVLKSKDAFNCKHSQRIFAAIGDTCCWYPGTDSTWILNNATNGDAYVFNGNDAVIENKTISINGTFFVDSIVGIEFRNCKIRLGPHAKIVATASHTGFHIDSSLVTACLDTMWDGIYVENDFNFQVYDNRPPYGAIEKAENGIVFDPDVLFFATIRNNDFRYNGTGIRINDGTLDGTATANPDSIFDNDFYSKSDSMLYPLTTNDLGNAIRIDSATVLINGIHGNHFFDLDTGIISKNSEGIIDSNYFDLSDVGIFSEDDTIKITRSEFFGVGIGIAAKHTRMWVDSNMLDSMHIGIHAYDSAYIAASRNEFTRIRKYSNKYPQSGAAIKANDTPTLNPVLGDLGTQLYVGDTSFYVPSVPSLVTTYGNHFENCDFGIRARDNVTLNVHHNRYDTIAKVAVYVGNTHSQDVKIYGDTMGEAVTGIRLSINDQCDVEIDDNVIYADTSSNAPLRTGISIFESLVADTTIGSTHISDNDIRLRGTAVEASNVRPNLVIEENLIRLYPIRGNGNDRGIQVFASDSAKILSNSITAVDTYPVLNTIGIHLTQSEEALISCNDIYYFHDGLLLHGQSFGAEIWDNTIHKAMYGMHFLNNAWLGTQGASLIPINNRWLQFEVDSVLEIMTYANNTNGNLNDSWVQSDSLSYPDHNVYQNNWDKNIHNQKLTIYVSTTNTRLDDCPSDLQKLDNSGTGGASRMTELLARDTTDFDHWTDEMPHYRDLYMYEMLTLDDQLRFSDTLYEYLYDDLEETNIKKIYDAQVAIWRGNLDDAETENEFTPDNDLEEEFQFAISKLIEVLENGTGSLTTTDSSSLDTLAKMCPIEGGYGVLVSRAILLDLDPSLDFSNDCIDYDSSSSKRHTSPDVTSIPNKSPRMKIFPNPTRESFKVSLLTGGGEIRIYGIDSKLKVVSKVNEGDQILEVNTEDWVKGVYIVRFHDIHGEIMVRKLILF